MSNFVHLHVHSEFSLLNSACKLESIILHVKELGQTAVAITDSGNMYGTIDFYKIAKKEGIKPILGCEFYVINKFNTEIYNIILLCKNNVGYQNLIKLVSEAHLKKQYEKIKINEELLKKYNNGLIALSDCLNYYNSRDINNYEDIKSVALNFNNIFENKNFYIELKNYKTQNQAENLLNLINLAKEINIPVVATNNCHYVKQEDSKIHEILLKIQSNNNIENINNIYFESDQFYIKSEDEMRDLFKQCPEAIENTKKIADMCNVEIEFDKPKLPNFKLNNNRDNFEYLSELSYNGLYKKFGQNPGELIINRFNYELSAIKKMGYVDYYLIVYDFVSYARSINIAVGPGRGSGTGSLIAYCIDITEINPIKYNLLFERFLNPGRISMPDFDIDFCYTRRQEVINYVIKKYGQDHVAQIVTFGTMAAKGAIRDVSRALGLTYSDVNLIIKLIPRKFDITIDEALKNSPRLRQKYNEDQTVKNLIDLAKKVEGLPRHISIHAAGVIITDQPINNYVPLTKSDETIVTQYTSTNLEKLGLLKIDFLGLRTLTVINDTVKIIKKRNPNFDINNISLNDKDVFNMLLKGDTIGVFQYESNGLKNLLVQLKPKNLEDLIAATSLYRPGPKKFIPRYIKNREHPELITYKHPLLKEILDVTYGCIIYQEQVMQIFKTLAGFSLERADIVRRAMAKRQKDIMEREHQIFIHGLTKSDGTIEIEGCIRRGIDEKTASDIYSEMENFSSYAFNKSHAAAYSLITYRTAFLKCKYPTEYMASLITNTFEDINKLIEYINECKNLKIRILVPDINESLDIFTANNNTIRFGFSAIKGLGKALIEKILFERKNGKFTSLYNFCDRVCDKGIQKKTIENLIKSGAFDSLGINRRQMLTVLNNIIEKVLINKKKNITGQISFFDSIENQYTESIKFTNSQINISKIKEFPLNEIWQMEKEATGIYLSGHPLDKYSSLIESQSYSKINNIISKFRQKIHINKNKIKLIAIISDVELKTSHKNKNTYAFVNIEDMSGSMKMIVFNSVFEKCSYLFMPSNIVEIYATLSYQNDNKPRLICKNIFLMTDARLKKELHKKSPGLYLKIKNFSYLKSNKIFLLLSIFEGNIPVYIFLEDKNKLFVVPKKFWVSINSTLIKELKNKLGVENVIFIS